MAPVPVEYPGWPPLFGNGPGVGAPAETADRNAGASVFETAASMAWSPQDQGAIEAVCAGSTCGTFITSTRLPLVLAIV